MLFVVARCGLSSQRALLIGDNYLPTSIARSSVFILQLPESLRPFIPQDPCLLLLALAALEEKSVCEGRLVYLVLWPRDIVIGYV